MIGYLKSLFQSLAVVLHSKYKWLLILFVLWLYRVDFISADGGGLAKGLQVITIFGLLYLVLSNKKSIVSYAYNRTNLPVQSVLWLYTYAVISTLWALIPTFAFFLSFQNVVLIFVLLWVISLARDFIQMEKFLLIFSVLVTLFEVVCIRILNSPTLFIHYLSGGSAAAICIAYSVGELLANHRLNKERKKLLKNTLLISLFILVTSTSSGANASAVFGFIVALFLSGKFLYALLRKKLLKNTLLISLFILVTSTSSGANASAVFGFIVALFLSGKFLYALLLLCFGLFLYLNPHLIETLILMVMPGKTLDSLQSSSGRTALWDILYELAAQKPLFGWGYACIERAVTQTGFMASDAHNNYLGIYGSLGIVGCIFLAIQMLSSVVYTLQRRMRPGYVGLTCAFCCAILNGYSYGFLSGKACSITVIYFCLVILTFTYSKVPYAYKPTIKQ